MVIRNMPILAYLTMAVLTLPTQDKTYLNFLKNALARQAEAFFVCLGYVNNWKEEGDDFSSTQKQDLGLYKVWFV